MMEAIEVTLTKWKPWGPGVSPAMRTLTVVGPIDNQQNQKMDVVDHLSSQ